MSQIKNNNSFLIHPRTIILVVSFSVISACFFTEIILRLNAIKFSLGYRPAVSNKIIYELYPGYTMKSVNAKISAQGLNEKIFNIKKTPGVIRIAVVGDSAAFGWKVGREKRFSNVLEKQLNLSKIGKYEIINFSVPGYNTAQEYEVIKDRVLKYSPDLVLLVFCANDVNVCNMIKPEITRLNYFFHKPFLFYRTAFIVDQWLMAEPKNVPIKRYFWPKWTAFKKNILKMYYYMRPIYPYPGLESVITVERNPPKNTSQVPPRYWYMLGYDNYEIFLSKIDSLLSDKRVGFVSCGLLTREAIQAHHKLNLNYFNFEPILNQHPWEAVRLEGRGDAHMTVYGHSLIAEKLEEYLLENNPNNLFKANLSADK